MKKQLWESKTLWGFGLVVIVVTVSIFHVPSWVACTCKSELVVWYTSMLPIL